MLSGRDELGHRSETVRRANLSAIVRELHAEWPDVPLRPRHAHRADPQRDPRPHRGARRRRPRQREPGRSRRTPGQALARRPPRSHGAIVLAFEIAVDSLAAAAVGLGGRPLELLRIDLPRGRSSVDDIAAALAELAATIRERLPASATLVGAGTAVVGVIRRSDGMVSMAPNLGWRDEPLGDATDPGAGPAGPDRLRQRV